MLTTVTDASQLITLELEENVTKTSVDYELLLAICHTSLLYERI